MTPRTRVAVVGVGVAGRSHLLDAVTNSALEVVATCARSHASATACADAFGVASAYDDLAEMLATAEPDAVIVATPPNVLAAQAGQALRAGVDVLCEKPLATSGRELAELEEAIGVSGRTVVVPYTRRYRAAWRRARDWVRDGRIGDLRRSHYRRRGPYAARYASTADTYRSDGRERVAGVLLDSGSHALDAIRWLGSPLGPVGRAELDLDDAGTDVGASVRLLAGPAEVVVELRDGGREEIEEVVIVGSQGEIQIAGGAATLRRAGVIEEVAQDAYVRRPVDDLVAVRAREAHLGASFAEAADVVRSVEAIYRAAGRPLRQTWRRPRAKALARLSGAC